MNEAYMKSTHRSSIGHFTELENILYKWIDAMRQAKLEVLPSLEIQKAVKNSKALDLPEGTFKASWCWFAKFRS